MEAHQIRVLQRRKTSPNAFKRPFHILQVNFGPTESPPMARLFIRGILIAAFIQIPPK